MMRLPKLFTNGYKPLNGQSRLFLSPFGAYPSAIVALAFILFYLLAILYCYSHFYRDPTSLFWDPNHGYDKAYSIRREQEAAAFIDAINADTTAVPRIHLAPPPDPTLCLGVATVVRPNQQYIDKTVGSLLAGLNGTALRDELHFVFFVAHTNPNVHPVNGQPWTQYLPDTLLDYDRRQIGMMQKIKSWEANGDHRSKGFYDYAYLLRACEKTGAPYIAMLEGDVLAAPGWLERSIWAAKEVDAAYRRVGGAKDEQGGEDGTESTTGRPEWLYIRMFWTETYLGWNSEEWPTYFFYSAIVWVALVAAFLGARIWSPRARAVLTNPVVALLSCVCLPMVILLYFAAGRMSMQPPPSGVRRMDNYGCCSQGMIFPREQVPAIGEAIDQKIEGYMDMLLETLAIRDRLEKWAIFPSLLQHIGSESSKDDPVADARARMIWNFAFERYGEILEKGGSLWRNTR